MGCDESFLLIRAGLCVIAVTGGLTPAQAMCVLVIT
jgi:hypothetical protein